VLHAVSSPAAAHPNPQVHVHMRSPLSPSIHDDNSLLCEVKAISKTSHVMQANKHTRFKKVSSSSESNHVTSSTLRNAVVNTLLRQCWHKHVCSTSHYTGTLLQAKRCYGTSLLLPIAGCLEASPRRAVHRGGVAIAGSYGLCVALEVGCGQTRGDIHRCDRGARVVCTRHSSSSVHRLGSTLAFAGGACPLPDRPPNALACQHHTGRIMRIHLWNAT
jgi:hypothetical protein